MTDGALAIALLGILGWVIAESAARWTRLADVPLYSRDPALGYKLRSGERGVFRRRWSWAVNERSMLTPRAFTPRRGQENLLLIGDSLVMGGNEFHQGERLAAQLEAACGCMVWPICANSWALVNELTYLVKNPDVAVAADRLVFVLNSKDFAPSAKIGDATTHPTHRPVSVVLYLAHRYLARRAFAKPPAPFVVGEEWRAALVDMSVYCRASVLFVLYPSADELADTALEEQRFAVPHSDLQRLMPAARIVRLARDPQWRSECYRDLLHPNVRGTAILAECIASALADEVCAGKRVAAAGG